MGFTIGMPCLKLSNVAKDTKHSGVFRKVVAEALKERHGKDKDIDKNKTSENIYFGFKTAEELIEYSEKFIIEVNTEVEEYNQTAPVGAKKRKVREDAVVMCATIIKPPAEMMQQLSEEEQEKLLNDALEKFKEIVGEKNVKSAVIHKDELVIHMHIFWQPVTKDGRLCAKEMHNKEFLRKLNKEMPEHLRSKGWYMVDDCKAYEEGSQEKKKAKRKSGKTSKVYKHEMDSLAEELVLQREEIQKKEKEIDERIDFWIARDRKVIEGCKKVESLLAEINKARIEVDELKQESIREANEILLEVHAEVAKLEEQKTVLTTEVETLYKELEIIRQENQLLNCERDRMIPEIEKLEEEIEESQQVLSQLDVTKEEVTELQKQKKNLSEEVSTLQSESERLALEKKRQIATAQTELENLKKQIAEMQDEIQKITLPESPTCQKKPRQPRPKQSREMYVISNMGDDASTMNFFDRKKEEKRLGREYDSLVDEWNKYDAAVKKYTENTYPQWVKSTETVRALQERLQLVNSRQQALEKDERTVYYAEELRLIKEVKELKRQNENLKKEKEDLQTKLDFIISQMRNIVEQEYQKRRKKDAEVIASYQQYCGVSPDKIEKAVMEQEKDHYSLQDYDSH